MSGLRSARGRFRVSCVAGNRISAGSASTGNDVDAVSSDMTGNGGNQVQTAAVGRAG